MLYNMNLMLSPNPALIQRISRLPDTCTLELKYYEIAETDSSINLLDYAAGAFNAQLDRSRSSDGLHWQQEPTSQWQLLNATTTYTE